MSQSWMRGICNLAPTSAVGCIVENLQLLAGSQMSSYSMVCWARAVATVCVALQYGQVHTHVMTAVGMLTLDPLCRLVKGTDLASVIEAVQHKVSSSSTPVAEVAALQTWVWQLTLHVAHALAQVGWLLL